MLEKDIEKKVCDYAKERGCLVYKFTSPARAAVPDRMFIAPNGKLFFAEFKQKGKKLTGPQEREFARLIRYAVRVEMVDNVDFGKWYVDEMVSV